MLTRQFIKATKQFNQLGQFKQFKQICQISTETINKNIEKKCCSSGGNCCSHKKQSKKTKQPKQSKQTEQSEQTERKIDDISINWVLTLLNKDLLKLSDNQIADLHGHSGGSWQWTNRQVKIIKDKGFNEWFYKTDGPLGYGVAFSKLFK